MQSLTNPRDFNSVYRQAKPRFGKYLVLSALPNTGNVTRAGFAVGRKVGNAVTRNRVKRRLREILREFSPAIGPGYDMVIGAKRSSAQASFSELRADLYRLLQGSGFLTRNSGGDGNA